MKSKVTLTVTMIIVLIGALGIALSNETHDKPVVILAEKQGDNLVYKVDGEKVVDGKLMNAMIKYMADKGRYYPIIVLVDDNASFKEQSNIDGMLGKVGFSKIRYFIFSSKHKRMTEIGFGPTACFSIEEFPDNMTIIQ